MVHIHYLTKDLIDFLLYNNLQNNVQLDEHVQ